MTEYQKDTMSKNHAGPVILAVDTSSPRIDLAITRGAGLLSSITASRAEQHSRTLFNQITSLLDHAALSIEAVDLFAVVTGPGSFTGLRVGMSAVKGLAASSRRPVFGLDLLELKIRGVGLATTALIICDSGRGEIFCGRRQLLPDGRVLKLHEDGYGDPSSALRLVLTENPPRNLVVTGNGIERAASELRTIADHHGIQFSPNPIGLPISPLTDGWQVAADPEPSAITLARTVNLINSSETLCRRPTCDPFYIRPSDAELNWNR